MSPQIVTRYLATCGTSRQSLDTILIFRVPTTRRPHGLGKRVLSMVHDFSDRFLTLETVGIEWISARQLCRIGLSMLRRV